MKPCWFMPPGRPMILRRNAAIGDVIACTVVADKLSAQGFDVTFQAHPAIQPLLKRHVGTRRVTDVNGTAHINLDGVYEDHPLRTQRHFSELFLAAANSQLAKRGISLGGNINCRAVLNVHTHEKLPYLARLSRYPKPWVFICPRSQNWANRTIQPHVWEEAAKLIPGTKFWLGTDAAPKGIENPEVRNIGDLPIWLACADLLVSVDTGPLHVAAAVGTPCVAIEQASSPELHLSDQRDFVVLRHPQLGCLNCQKNICPIKEHIPPCQLYPPELIADAVNRRLRSITSEDVSAVIPVFKPPLKRLQQCIEHVRQQVAEIIVTCDAGGVIPDGAPRGDGIRYVKHRLHNLGFGKNVNFGARHANGKYLLLLNDDVFLRPGAVAKLRECMQPNVGIVGHLLYYADGTIQHGGKYRSPGMRGWGHVDHRRFLPTVTAPIQCENVTAASVLVNRRAFFDVGGFNEEFFMYAEDDALCLQMLQRGYKVIYTPLAVGTHLESQSSKDRPDFHDNIREGNKIFWKNWGWWIEENLHRVPGVF